MKIPTANCLKQSTKVKLSAYVLVQEINICDLNKHRVYFLCQQWKNALKIRILLSNDASSS